MVELSELVADEIDALRMIYGNEFSYLENLDVYEVAISSSFENEEIPVTLIISLPENYPKEDPPLYTVRSKKLSSKACQRIQNKLLKMFVEDKSDQNLMNAIEYIRNDAYLDLKDISAVIEEKSTKSVSHEGLPTIYKGECVEYKNSTFLAHFAFVKTHQEIENIQNFILSSKKFATATHNMVAYRLEDENDLDEFKDDDGESGASIRLLDLLRQLDLVNVYVMVTRWFGGIMLGPLRFRLIVKTAKDLIVQHCNDNTEDSDVSGEKKKKLRTIPDVMNRIRWDPTFNPSEFSIGYEDRFTGIEEVSWEDWEEVFGLEVPLHRIQYFKKNGNVVWDRHTRKDKIFNTS